MSSLLPQSEESLLRRLDSDSQKKFNSWFSGSWELRRNKLAHVAADGVDRLSETIFSIFINIGIGHFFNRFADEIIRQVSVSNIGRRSPISINRHRPGERHIGRPLV
ncbi:hypothetical protein F2P81_003375 [Scophthalmus maximus]|uniref:Uncharacterized protein n=1 Tax=Scophthalmus maximus TaxID=52904 RepID=A0A6A4TCJ6_SCOMX|nr:hypothetical protein F2P81_003375 [Scophthalmus maximus]